MNSFYSWETDTLRLNVLGTPGAKQNKIGKVKGNQLKVSVNCAAEKGKTTNKDRSNGTDISYRRKD